MAVLNYRRAAIVAPGSEDGQAAARAIGEFQKDAAAKLHKVDRLVASQEFDQAFQSLNELSRHYSALAIGPKIEQVRRRVQRLQEGSERVAKVESRSDRAAEDPAGGRVAELAQPRDARAPVGAGRRTLDSIHKLAEQTRDDSQGPRLRGSEPRR